MTSALNGGGQLHAQAALPQENSPWYPSDRRLGGFQSRSGRGGKEKNFQPMPGLEPPLIQPVAHHCIAERSRLLVIYYTYTEVRAMYETFLQPVCGTDSRLEYFVQLSEISILIDKLKVKFLDLIKHHAVKTY
jgi:hypothetical protein